MDAHDDAEGDCACDEQQGDDHQEGTRGHVSAPCAEVRRHDTSLFDYASPSVDT